jgi:hypothetical protein
VIKYKQSKKNLMVDALSPMYVFFSTLNAKLLGFEHVKDLYDNDIDFV